MLHCLIHLFSFQNFIPNLKCLSRLLCREVIQCCRGATPNLHSHSASTQRAFRLIETSILTGGVTASSGYLTTPQNLILSAVSPLVSSILMNGVVCILLHKKRTDNARDIYFFFLISSSDNPNFVGRTTSPPISVLEVWVGLPPLLGVKGKHVTQDNVAFFLLLTKPML